MWGEMMEKGWGRQLRHADHYTYACMRPSDPFFLLWRERNAALSGHARDNYPGLVGAGSTLHLHKPRIPCCCTCRTTIVQYYCSGADRPEAVQGGGRREREQNQAAAEKKAHGAYTARCVCVCVRVRVFYNSPIVHQSRRVKGLGQP